MKATLITLAAVTAMLAAPASAGMVFGGKCPTVTSVAYANSMSSSHNHALLYLDKWVASQLNMIRGLASFVPDLKCFDAGAFGWDSTMYTN